MSPGKAGFPSYYLNYSIRTETILSSCLRKSNKFFKTFNHDNIVSCNLTFSRKGEQTISTKNKLNEK